MKKDMELKLREAFVKIMDKKQSVTNLCEKADISRATFYLYYKDIDEFIKKTKEYITKKYFEQIAVVFFSDEEELPHLLKKENLLFDETDRKLLAHIAEGSEYIAFATTAAEWELPSFKELCREKFGEELYSKNERKIIYCLNGIAPLLFFDIVNYDERKIVTEMLESRKIINTLIES